MLQKKKKKKKKKKREIIQMSGILIFPNVMSDNSKHFKRENINLMLKILHKYFK